MVMGKRGKVSGGQTDDTWSEKVIIYGQHRLMKNNLFIHICYIRLHLGSE